MSTMILVWMLGMAAAWEPDLTGDDAWMTFRGASSTAVFGARVRLGGDFDDDGAPDLVVSAPRESDNTGSVYVFTDLQAGIWHADEDEWAEWSGDHAGAWAGFGVTVLPIEDGPDALVVGARLDRRAAEGAGAAYLLPSQPGEARLADAMGIWTGSETREQAGFDVAPAGLGPDGEMPHLWVSVPFEADRAGALYLVPALVPGEDAVADVSVSRWQGEAAGDTAGFRLAHVGDVDGDGVDELLLGAEGSDRNGADAGAAYLVSATQRGDQSLSGAMATWIGERAGDRAGAAVSAVGDLDGDGEIDVAVAARGDDTGGEDAGALYISRGPHSGANRLSDAYAKLTGEEAGDVAGAHATSCDLDGDGALDLVVGAHAAGPSQQGRAYVLFGPLEAGTRSLATADVIIRGTTPDTKMGQDLSCADIDGDGYADLAVGAEGEPTARGGAFAGVVYVFAGRPRASGCGCATGPSWPGALGVVGLLTLMRLIPRRRTGT